MTSNKLVDILAPKIVGPEGPYRCVYLDPPWPERGGGKIKRGADRHYDTLTVRKIVETIDKALGWGDHGPGPCSYLHVADNAHCWMWVTDNYLRHGLTVMEGMGFRYKRTLVWVKISPGNIEKWAKLVVEHVREPFTHSQDPVTDKRRELLMREFIAKTLEGGFLNSRKLGLLRSGLGQYARGSHEILLFGTKGKAHMPPTDARPKSVQFAPVSEHSTKPELFADIIEACSPGPRLEMLFGSVLTDFHSRDIELPPGRPDGRSRLRLRFHGAAWRASRSRVLRGDVSPSTYPSDISL